MLTVAEAAALRWALTSASERRAATAAAREVARRRLDQRLALGLDPLRPDYADRLAERRREHFRALGRRGARATAAARRQRRDAGVNVGVMAPATGWATAVAVSETGEHGEDRR